MGLRRAAAGREVERSRFAFDRGRIAGYFAVRCIPIDALNPGRGPRPGRIIAGEARPACDAGPVIWLRITTPEPESLVPVGRRLKSTRDDKGQDEDAAG